MGTQVKIAAQIVMSPGRGKLVSCSPAQLEKDNKIYFKNFITMYKCMAIKIDF